jgi:hypothetical protein
LRTPSSCLDAILRKAFVAAYLLTANASQAENAVMEAINSWNPDIHPEEWLIYRALQASDVSHSPYKPELGASLLPAELKAVLRLSCLPRQCFVLRILAGLPRKVCAGMLRLSMANVDRHLWAALKCLAGLPAISELASA